MRIRKAIPDDALAIKIIHNKTYQTSYRGYVPNEYLDDLIITCSGKNGFAKLAKWFCIAFKV